MQQNNDRGREMMGFIPWYYEDSTVMNQIICSQSEEIVAVRSTIMHILAQFYVDTAAEDGIVLWEKELGLTPSEEASLDLRRAQVKAKLQLPAIMTPLQIQSIVNLFVNNHTAKVVELPGTYHFRIDIPFGDLIWSAEMRQAVEEAKPAHLGYSIRYTLYGDLDDSINITDSAADDLNVAATFIFDDVVPYSSKTHHTFDGSCKFASPVLADGSWGFDGSLKFNAVPRGAIKFDSSMDEVGPIEISLTKGLDDTADTAIRFNGAIRFDGREKFRTVIAPVDEGGELEIRIVHRFDGKCKFDNGDRNRSDGTLCFDGRADFSGRGIQFEQRIYRDDLSRGTGYKKVEKNVPWDLRHPQLDDDITTLTDGSLTTQVLLSGFEDDAVRHIVSADGTISCDGTANFGVNVMPLDSGGELEIIQVHKMDGSYKFGDCNASQFDGTWPADGTIKAKGGITFDKISRPCGSL